MEITTSDNLYSMLQLKKRNTIYLLRILLFCCCVAPITITAQKVVYKDSAVIQFFQRTTGLVAGDGGYSIALNNGGSLWTFGDSHIDDYDAATKTANCIFQVRNAALLQPVGDWNWEHTATLTGNYSGIKSYFKNNTDDDYYSWPGSGIQIKDTIYVFCKSMKNSGSGAFGFASTGVDYWAKISATDPSNVTYENLRDFDSIMFDIGFIKGNNDGFVYAYGQKVITHGMGFNTHVYVARFAVSSPATNWTFWDGHNWVADIERVKAVAVENGVSFHASQLRDCIVLTSCELSLDCDMGRSIFTSFSENITGPFSKPKLVYSVDDTLNGHYPFFYLPALHPEHINDKDEILLTYSINGYGKCSDLCSGSRMNPDIYRVRGIRVPVKTILSKQ